MKTARLIAIALTGAAVAAPAAQAAPPRVTHATGLPKSFKLVNLKAKKQAKRQRATARASWLYDGVLGRPGSVTVATPVHALDVTLSYMFSPGVLTPITFKQMQNANGPTVSRSTATTGAQDVSIIYSLQVWNGSQWVQRSTASGTARIPAGYSSVRLPHLTAFPNIGNGYFRVVEAMGWYVAGTNSLLGSTAIVPHFVSDHVCTTPIRGCTAYAGYLQFG